MTRAAFRLELGHVRVRRSMTLSLLTHARTPTRYGALGGSHTSHGWKRMSSRHANLKSKFLVGHEASNLELELNEKHNILELMYIT